MVHKLKRVRFHPHRCGADTLLYCTFCRLVAGVVVSLPSLSKKSLSQERHTAILAASVVSCGVVVAAADVVATVVALAKVTL